VYPLISGRGEKKVTQRRTKTAGIVTVQVVPEDDRENIPQNSRNKEITWVRI